MLSAVGKSLKLDMILHVKKCSGVPTYKGLDVMSPDYWNTPTRFEDMKDPCWLHLSRFGHASIL